MSQICRNCHVNNGKLFDGSPHKAAFEKHGWPECETCHGKHDIQKPNDAMLGTGPKSICKECHDEYGKPACNETAQYFHDQIVGLVAARDRANAAIRKAEEEGNDLADLEFQLQAVEDSLVESRSKIHTFNRTEFDGAAKKGYTLVEGAEKTARTAEEHEQRQVGLAISTLMVTFVAGLLYLKIRQIDRATGFDPNDKGE